MSDITDQMYGVFRFGIPDQSVGPEGRSLFAFPASKEIKEEKLKLHDARTDPNIVHGPKGLDVQGFAYLKHSSKLAESDRWFADRNIEETYFPEVIDLICQATGAHTAGILDCAFRRKLAEDQADLGYYAKKGDKIDQEIAKMPRDVALVYGKEAGGALEPARLAHVDYTNEGLRSTARYRRKDIVSLAEKVLKAEDAVAKGESVRVPRYAAFSVWRPVRTVHRDPLAVCDARTIDETEQEASKYRAVSNVTENGEYHLEAFTIHPPKEPEKQRWYWMPEQRQDEVLIIKFADTAAEEDPNIARGCPHVSPIIPGTENEEPRCSLECRVIAFWE